MRTVKYTAFMFITFDWLKTALRFAYFLACLLTYLLTYSMEQSPSWEANFFSASQEIPRILWDPKVHYLVCTNTPPIPILSQINQVRVPHPTSWRYILILSFHLCLGLPSGLLPSGFSTKTLYAPLLSPHTYYMPHPFHSSFFDHPNNMWWRVQIINFII